jgi:tripartite ATP-independent transporter DctP family solute receptor
MTELAAPSPTANKIVGKYTVAASVRSRKPPLALGDVTSGIVRQTDPASYTIPGMIEGRRQLWVGGYGPEHSSHGRGLARFRDVVEEESAREIEVRVTWNIMDEGRRNTDLFDLVESGEMFMCYFSSSYLGPRVPQLNVLEVPFLFDDLASAHRALDGDLGQKMAEAVRAATGFELLGMWDNGFRHFTNRLRPVRSPSDCVGMTVRVQPNPIHESLFRAWGAIPKAMDLNRGIEAISSGEVDAQENPLANTVAYGVDRVHRFVTMTGHLYGARGLWANRNRMETLPADVADLVRRAAREAIVQQRKDAAEGEKQLRRRLEEQGVEFVDLGGVERQEFIAASRQVIDEAIASLPDDMSEWVSR